MGTFEFYGPLEANSDMFLGRKDELQELIQVSRLPIKSYYMLMGGRQTGKTSLLIRLRSQLAQTVASTRIDLQAVPGSDLATALTFIAREIASSLNAPAPKINLKVSEFGIFIVQLFKEKKVEFYILIIEEIGVLPLDTQKELAMIIRYLFTNRLSSKTTAVNNLLVILAGSIELYDLAVSKASPLQNVCKRIYLSDLSKQDTLDLISRGFTGTSSSEFQIRIGEKIFQLVEGHPYLTQRLGKQILENIDPKTKNLEKQIDELANNLIANDTLFNSMFDAAKEFQLLGTIKELFDKRIIFSRQEAELSKLELLGCIKPDQENYCTFRSPLIAKTAKGWLDHRIEKKQKKPIPWVKVTLIGLLMVIGLWMIYYTHPSKVDSYIQFSDILITVRHPASVEVEEKGALELIVKNTSEQRIDSASILLYSEDMVFNHENSNRIIFRHLDNNQQAYTKTVQFEIKPAAGDLTNCTISWNRETKHLFHMIKLRPFPFKKHAALISILGIAIVTVISGIKSLIGILLSPLKR